MGMSLLTTKVYIPPVRPELVPRPRLVERLEAGLDRKLTLVSAPAGFGKTALLSEWIHSLVSGPSHAKRERGVRVRAAWLSLDEGDNDPVRFWRYVIGALQTADDTIGRTVQAVLQSPQPPPLETIVTALVNDITAASEASLDTGLPEDRPTYRERHPRRSTDHGMPRPYVLVLDDYHVIHSDAIHTSLNLLLDHVPPQLHLFIATREDPPLALSLRRGRRELAELRAADLRFTAEETGEFLNAVAGLNLSAEDVAALEGRTEGWIVGLQMAALSLQQRDPLDRHAFVAAFAGDDRYVVDYLVEEVFRRQPSRVQTFLLQTSILDRLCGPLCDAVTGRDDGQAILAYLERANLFVVPLDNRRYWYRYHTLFADLLRQRLGQSVEADGLMALHRRASTWFEREGLLAEAVSQALADCEHAADLVERHVLDVFYRSETVLVYNWLKALPEDVIRARPLLCAVYANVIVLTSPSIQGATGPAEQWLREAESGLAARSGYDAAAGFVATFRAYLSRFRGDPPQTVIDLSQKALASLPEGEMRFRSALANNMGMAYRALGEEEAASRAFAQARQIGEQSGDLFNAVGAAYFQAQIAYHRGRLRDVAAICREALRSFGDPVRWAGRPVPYAGTIYVALGSVLLEWNELQEAERILRMGLELLKLTTSHEQTCAYTALARLKAAQGDGSGALALLEQAPQGEKIETYLVVHRARLWLALAQNDPRYLIAAAQWAQEQQIRLGGSDQYDPARLTFARLLVAQYRAAPARPGSDLHPVLQFLDRQLYLAETQGRLGRMIEVSILRALALQARDDIPQAIASLQQAIALAEPEGYVRIFLDEGAPMAALLQQVARCAVTPGYAGQLLAAFGAAEIVASAPFVSAQGGPLPLRPSALIEPLSEREIEVLRLIAAGAPNPEIAQELFIAVNTVKKHITNIFGKLGVVNRTQAAARARELGLVE